MDVQQDKRSHQKRNIEYLAQESEVSIGEVTKLYEDEQARLEVGARLTSFLPIFTIRHVRETLRRRSTAKRASTLEGREAAPPG